MSGYVMQAGDSLRKCGVDEFEIIDSRTGKVRRRFRCDGLRTDSAERLDWSLAGVQVADTQTENEHQDALAAAKCVGLNITALAGLPAPDIRRVVLSKAVPGLRLDGASPEFIAGAWKALRADLEHSQPLHHHEDIMHSRDIPQLTYRQMFELQAGTAYITDDSERQDVLAMNINRRAPVHAQIPALASVRPEQQERRNKAGLSPRQKLMEANKRAAYDNDFSGYEQ